jgi:outer membrane protein
MKRLLLTILLLVFSLPALAAESKIAFVDLEYALNNVEEGKKAKAILEQNYKQQKEALAATFAKIETMSNELKSTTLVLSDEARRKKEQELSDAVAAYEKDKKTAYESWQKKEANLTRDLLEGLTSIVQEIGREGGYTFILERHDASVLYAQDNIDLTKQVIDRFNKKGGR